MKKADIKLQKIGEKAKRYQVNAMRNSAPRVEKSSSWVTIAPLGFLGSTQCGEEFSSQIQIILGALFEKKEKFKIFFMIFSKNICRLV